MKYFFFLFVFVSTYSFGQIAHYNQFPTMQHMRNDSILDSISFAFSMRQIYDDYLGPIIRLRRASDNAEMDFCADSDTIVDIDSINNWRSGSNVYVTTWYDQSGMSRNAVQDSIPFQPRFIPNATRPYFFGDGVDDRLDVLTSIQVLTDSGVNGTVMTVAYSTSEKQMSFGSLISTNRWSAHINWNNGRCYFDPGICCSPNNDRSFVNPINNWEQFTFIRTDTRAIARRDNVQVLNALHTKGRCTLNNTFGILYANGTDGNYSTNRFTELIMYKYDISAVKINAIELDEISFWNL